jgi:hypothetical protein
MTQSMQRPTGMTLALAVLGLGALLLAPAPGRSQPPSGKEEYRLLIQTVQDGNAVPAPPSQAEPCQGGQCGSGPGCEAKRKVRQEMARLAAQLERQRVEMAQTGALLQQARERLAELEKQANQAGASVSGAAGPENKEGAVRTPARPGQVQQRLQEMDRKLDALLAQMAALQQEMQAQRVPTIPPGPQPGKNPWPQWQPPQTPHVQPLRPMPPAPDTDPRATPTVPLTTTGEGTHPSR